MDVQLSIKHGHKLLAKAWPSRKQEAKQGTLMTRLKPDLVPLLKLGWLVPPAYFLVPVLPKNFREASGRTSVRF